eukprot:m.24557 g.24557  ORF g.24557 m.24557 type:complete len:344 (-) comp14645_c0_seq1:29-1060(-)
MRSTHPCPLVEEGQLQTLGIVNEIRLRLNAINARISTLEHSTRSEPSVGISTHPSTQRWRVAATYSIDTSRRSKANTTPPNVAAVHVKPNHYPQSCEKTREGVVRIVCISDTHNRHDELDLSELALNADVLVHTGDFTNTGTMEEIVDFADWLDKQPFKHKLVVPGNHDLVCDGEFYCNHWQEWHASRVDYTRALARLRESCTVLLDGMIIIKGVSFYGNSAQPRQPKVRRPMAFGMVRGEQLKAAWQKIPRTTNVLLTHTPPFGVLDTERDRVPERNHGCEELKKRLTAPNDIALHVFGHIHHCAGTKQTKRCLYVNASSCTRSTYDNLNAVIVVDLETVQS